MPDSITLIAIDKERFDAMDRTIQRLSADLSRLTQSIQNPNPEGYETAAQYSERTRTHISTVRRMCARGDLRTINKDGTHWRIALGQ